MGRGSAHEALVEDLTRRRFLRGAGALAIALSAGRLAAPTRAAAAPNASDAMLQAFADTMVPGRKAATTDLGNEIDPRAIAGVDPLPGAVEADALALYHHPEIGFDSLSGPFLADLQARSLPLGSDFLSLGWDQRVQ